MLPFKVCPFFYEKKKGQFEYLVFLKAIFFRALTAVHVEARLSIPHSRQENNHEGALRASQLCVALLLPDIILLV